MVEVEHEANGYHQQWENINETLTELQSVRREVHDEMMKCLEDLSHPWSFPRAGKATEQRTDSELNTLHEKL